MAIASGGVHCGVFIATWSSEHAVDFLTPNGLETATTTTSLQTAIKEMNSSAAGTVN